MTQRASHPEMKALPPAFRRSAFTLMELLVVVAIMILLFTIAVPGLRNLLNSGKMEQATGLVGTGAASVRAYASLRPPFSRGSYQGVALIFTPSNEMRMVRHVDLAKRTATDYLDDDTMAQGYAKAGYADIAEREYLMLPSGIGALGMMRGGGFGGSTPPVTRLLTPPFAIRFNANGHLIARSTNLDGNGLVYYDKDYDSQGYFNVDGRFDKYDPSLYDPDSPNYEPGAPTNAYDKVTGKHRLPFGAIETVPAVLLYDKAEFAAQGYTLEGNANRDIGDADAKQWLLDNGEIIYLNRYSGARLQP